MSYASKRLVPWDCTLYQPLRKQCQIAKSTAMGILQKMCSQDNQSYRNYCNSTPRDEASLKTYGTKLHGGLDSFPFGNRATLWGRTTFSGLMPIRPLFRLINFSWSLPQLRSLLRCMNSEYHHSTVDRILFRPHDPTPSCQMITIFSIYPVRYFQ